MTAPGAISAMPIAEGLTYLLREKTRAIDSECARFLAEGDAEALHDLRVAMRRLRSLFAGFALCFREGSTQPKRLRALHKETNAARDLEVTLALVEKLQLALPALQQQWREQLEQEYRRLREGIPPAWRALSVELTSPEGLLAESLTEMPLGAFAASLAGVEEKKLLRGMKSLSEQWKEQRAHKLRISGKRVRYLLEPFTEESKASVAAVAELKQFQDLLGDYHDVMVLRQRLHALRREDSREQRDQLERAGRRLKKTLRQLRKSFLHQYWSKQRRRLRDTLQQAQRSLTQS